MVVSLLDSLIRRIIDSRLPASKSCHGLVEHQQSWFLEKGHDDFQLPLDAIRQRGYGDLPRFPQPPCVEQVLHGLQVLLRESDLTSGKGRGLQGGLRG